MSAVRAGAWAARAARVSSPSVVHCANPKDRRHPSSGGCVTAPALAAAGAALAAAGVAAAGLAAVGLAAMSSCRSAASAASR